MKARFYLKVCIMYANKEWLLKQVLRFMLQVECDITLFKRYDDLSKCYSNVISHDRLLLNSLQENLRKKGINVSQDDLKSILRLHAKDIIDWIYGGIRDDELIKRIFTSIESYPGSVSND